MTNSSPEQHFMIQCQALEKWKLRGKRGLTITWTHSGLDASHLNMVYVFNHKYLLYFPLLVWACKTCYFHNRDQMYFVLWNWTRTQKGDEWTFIQASNRFEARFNWKGKSHHLFTFKAWVAFNTQILHYSYMEICA